MKQITRAVGNKAPNEKSDVVIIQSLINSNIASILPCLPLLVDGHCGPLTVALIKEFQVRCMKVKKPDGRVDPGKNTIKRLNELSNRRGENSASITQPITLLGKLTLEIQSFLKQTKEKTSLAEVKAAKLTESDYQLAATMIGAEVAAVKAVAKVESLGGGFLNSGKPKILFEGHWFSKLTKGVHNLKHPSISYAKWTKKHYIGGAGEYSRYNQAYALDKQAAMKSTSWGKFQIMGFNHKKAGFDSVEKFVKAMYVSEGNQLTAFVSFLKSTGLDAHLKSKDWVKFAKGYNGPKFAENKYDKRLKQAYEAFSG